MLANSVEVGAVLVHELSHAAHPDAGHKGAFKRSGLAIGLTGRMTATVPGDQLQHDLVALTERIGQPPVAGVDPRWMIWLYPLDSHPREPWRILPVDDEHDRLQIGEFAELVGLSIPQLRRYDRLRLLDPAGRSPGSGYRFYSRGQSGAARVIALLRSMDMPIAQIRRIVSGAPEQERRRILGEHRARLEARLQEVHRLLQAVDAMNEEEGGPMSATPEVPLSGWLHLMPMLPVTDMDRSLTYYQEAFGFRLAWRHASGSLAAVSSGDIETLLLVRWTEDSPPPSATAYVFVDDPDALSAEYTQAGADIADPVASRPSGMRDFVVRDPDGHRFRLGRAEERLREMTDQYLMEPPGEITVNPKLPRVRWD